MARLTPEQRAAMDQVAKANAAAAAAMAAPALRPRAAAAAPAAARHPRPGGSNPGIPGTGSPAAGRRSVQPGRVVRPPAKHPGGTIDDR